MKRIDKRTVELTRTERKAFDKFELLLDDGVSIITAVHILRVQHPRLDPAFFDWLVE